MKQEIKNRDRSTGFYFVIALVVFSAILVFSYFQSVDSVESILHQQIRDVVREAESGISRAFPIIDRETKLLSRNKALKDLYGNVEGDSDGQTAIADFVDRSFPHV